MIEYWTDSALNKIFRGTCMPNNAPKEIVLHLARNGSGSAQILLRSDSPFTIDNVAFQGLSGFACTVHFQEYIAFKDGVQHPDPLSNDNTTAVDAEATQGVWITLHAPADLPPCERCGSIIIQISEGKIAVPIFTKVYSVMLPDSRNAALSVEYWVNTVGYWWRYPRDEQRDFIRDAYGHEKYTEAWWQVVGAIACNMRDNRNNVLLVRTQDLLLDGGTALRPDGQYAFRWDRFDEYVRFFIERGAVKRLAGFHIIRQTEGGYVYLIGNDGHGNPSMTDALIGSAEAQNWLEQFLPALRRHLEDRGWLKLWMQHVEDEPAEAGSWIKGRKAIGQYMPGVPCFDALDNQEPCAALQGQMDLWVPRTDIYEENRAFYDYRLTLGEQRWTYTCCMPNTPNYLNKFIDLPYWHNRLLFWGCFLRGFTGFLHWGYNYWDANDEWFGLRPDAHFKGDGYIVYPDPKHNSVKNSARLINTRDSAEDYELLRIVAEKDPELAFSLAGRVLNSFRDFTWDIGKILQTREELLSAAERAYNQH